MGHFMHFIGKRRHFFQILASRHRLARQDAGIFGRDLKTLDNNERTQLAVSHFRDAAKTVLPTRWGQPQPNRPGSI